MKQSPCFLLHRCRLVCIGEAPSLEGEWAPHSEVVRAQTPSQQPEQCFSQLHSFAASPPHSFTAITASQASQIHMHEVSLQISFGWKVVTRHQCICHTLEDLYVLQKLMCHHQCALQKFIHWTTSGFRRRFLPPLLVGGVRSVKQFSLRMFQESISLILVVAELDLWNGFGC